MIQYWYMWNCNCHNNDYLLVLINSAGPEHDGQGDPDAVQYFTCTTNAASIQPLRLLDTPSPNPDPPLSFSMRPANM